jgi:hypothetical protein
MIEWIVVQLDDPEKSNERLETDIQIPVFNINKL